MNKKISKTLGRAFTWHQLFSEIGEIKRVRGLLASNQPIPKQNIITKFPALAALGTFCKANDIPVSHNCRRAIAILEYKRNVRGTVVTLEIKMDEIDLAEVLKGCGGTEV